MRISLLLHLLPSNEKLNAFKKALEKKLLSQGDLDLSNKTLDEIQLQIRACIQTEFDLKDHLAY